MAPVLPNPIASLMLEDIRRAATYLEEIGEVKVVGSVTVDGPIAREARGHARRLWSACQAVERWIVFIEHAIVQEPQRADESGES